MGKGAKSGRVCVWRKEDSHAEINLDAYEDEKEKKVTGNTLKIFGERKGHSCMLERSGGGGDYTMATM